MSLQLAAQHLASKGRGNDSRLIHISPNELKGLQAIARAKGGSLTINPETGLPEAGFLEDILPVAATAATMFFAPMAAPALGGFFGASGALATGLGAGLMAGGYSLLGQALGGQGINLNKALTTGAVSGLTAGALQGTGMYTPQASDVVTQTAATTQAPITAAQAIDKAPAFAYTPSGEMVSAAYPPSVTGAVNTAGVVPPPPSGVGPAAGISGKKMLGYGLAGTAALSLLGSQSQPKLQPFPSTPTYIRPYGYSSTQPDATGQYPAPYATTSYDTAGLPVIDTRERNYFDQGYTPYQPYQVASGGLLASGGPVERMSAMDQQTGMYPQGMIDKTYYATPTQRPASMEVVKADYDAPVNPITGLPPVRMAGGGMMGLIQRLIGQRQEDLLPQYQYDPVAQQYTDVSPNPIPASGILGLIARMEGNKPYSLPTYSYDPNAQSYQQMAMGGQAEEYNLGGYSDGGRLLKGPGDGVSDDIPAMIGKKQPARLADGEFVIPARIVSELGNGSTDAGARRLYAMMDRVQAKRQKSAKKGKFAMNTKAEKELPA